MDVDFVIDSSNVIPMDVPSIVQFDCIILDLVVAKDNIEIQKKIKKTYKLNTHFQDTWAIELLWAKFVLGFNGKITQVECMQGLHLDWG